MGASPNEGIVIGRTNVYTLAGACRMGSAQGIGEFARSWCDLRRGDHRSRRRLCLTRDDPDAGDEPRFVTLGLSNAANLLVVVYAYREPDIIRVISAWKASKPQRRLHEEGRR